MMKKKIYEVPVLCITELETNDIMMTSGLIGSELLARDEILSYGIIDYSMIEIDLQ